MAVTLKSLVPRSAPISSTLNTGRNDRREASHRNAVSLMDENSNDRENRRSLASRPFRSTDSRLSLLSLSYSFSPLVSLSLSPLVPPRIPFGFLRHDFQLQFRIDRSVARSTMLETLLFLSSSSFLSLSSSLALSFFLSQSAVDFLVHRPNFPGRYGQFNTGLPSTSPCQIGGRPLFQCLSWDKGQNRFLRAPQSESCGRYSNRGGS